MTLITGSPVHEGVTGATAQTENVPGDSRTSCGLNFASKKYERPGGIVSTPARATSHSEALNDCIVPVASSRNVKSYMHETAACGTPSVARETFRHSTLSDHVDPAGTLDES
ncbi:MAG TPA: hypothetical protein VN936_03580, partial [Candidatus Acidoferrum sp.]|nr:hypothetical protein [Candidatus Acidoferrum sp.]